MCVYVIGLKGFDLWICESTHSSIIERPSAHLLMTVSYSFNQTIYTRIDWLTDGYHGYEIILHVFPPPTLNMHNDTLLPACINTKNGLML